MIFTIHPLNLIGALSMALELSTGGLSRHHLRTAMLASRIGRYINLDDAQLDQLTYSALLHDLGAASNWQERMDLLEDRVPQAELYRHAEEGYRLLKDSPQLQVLAESIRHHHDNWDGSSPSGKSGNNIPLHSRMIHLSDRLEILIRDGVPIYDQKDMIIATIQNTPECFDPELVRALLELTEQESFWLDLENVNYYRSFFEAMELHGRMRFNEDDIVGIAEIFSTIIDRTSRFTAEHSKRVAKVAECLAMIKGYSTQEVKLMRIAGLFHDLGKLAVPNHILEKQGSLTKQEVWIIRQHPYYTYRILEKVNGFSPVKEWAALHHETPDGKGYPFRLSKDSLKLGSRIVAVADVYTALTEDRPYREGLTLNRAEQIMRTMAAADKLDRHLVGELFTEALPLYHSMGSIG